LLPAIQQTAKDLAQEQVTATLSIGDKLTNVIAFLLEKIFKLLEPMLNFIDEIWRVITGQQAQAKLGKDVVVKACSVIEDDAIVGDSTLVGAHVFIGKNVSIGSNVILHSGAKILDNCIVGDHSIIHSGVIIGSDGFGYQVTKMGLRKIPQIGNVVIGKYVEIGANSCIDRAAFESTIIEDGVKLDNQVHIAHGVRVGAGSAIIAQTGIAGSTIIGRGCQIGGQVGIKDHITIGNGAKIVSKSTVVKSVEEGEVVAGTPAMPFKKWRRMVAMLARLPEIVKKASELERMMLKRQKQAGWLRKLWPFG